MATELGGASIGIMIGDGTNPPPPDQFNAISNFFHGYYNQSVDQIPGPQAGEQIVTTDLGRTLHAFNEAAGPVIKLQGSGDGILGTGHGGTVRAGDGDNEILISDNSGYTLNLSGGNDYVQSSGSGPINVSAGMGSDVIVGGSGDDTQRGNLGSDNLLGGAGNDNLLGGKGADVLVGGPGDDTMKGGPGSDTFIIGNEATGNDSIVDFKKEDILQIQDRNGDGQVTVAPDGDVASIVHDTLNNQIIVTLQNGDTVTLDNIKNDKLNLTETTDGTFTLQ